MMRIERMTSPLPRECSTTELHGLPPYFLLRVLRVQRPPRSSGAGEGNRTLVISLEGFCSAIELHPPRLPDTSLHPFLSPPTRSIARNRWWRGLDSNQRRRKANRFTVCPL